MSFSASDHGLMHLRPARRAARVTRPPTGPLRRARDRKAHLRPASTPAGQLHPNAPIPAPPLCAARTTREAQQTPRPSHAPAPAVGAPSLICARRRLPARRPHDACPAPAREGGPLHALPGSPPHAPLLSRPSMLPPGHRIPGSRSTHCNPPWLTPPPPVFPARRVLTSHARDPSTDSALFFQDAPQLGGRASRPPCPPTQPCASRIPDTAPGAPLTWRFVQPARSVRGGTCAAHDGAQPRSRRAAATAAPNGARATGRAHLHDVPRAGRARAVCFHHLRQPLRRATPPPPTHTHAYTHRILVNQQERISRWNASWRARRLRTRRSPAVAQTQIAQRRPR